MAVTFQLKPGALEKLLKREPGVQAALNKAGAAIRDSATAKSYADGHPCTYHMRENRNNAGFPHVGVFISWKRKSSYFETAVDHLRNSI